MKILDKELLPNNNETIRQFNSYLKEVYNDETMTVLHVNDNTISPELYLYYCGISSCQPGHTWGPAVRDHYVIHYILSGTGTLTLRDKTYTLREHEGFLLSPHDISTYSASHENPWEYVWVGFHGLNASYYLQQAGLSSEVPTFHFTRGEQLKNCMLEMVRANNEYTHSTKLRIQSLLYSLFSELVENAQHDNAINPQSMKNQYIRKAVDYIQINYMNSITVSDLADYVGLERSYFTTIFKEYLNIPPQKFLSLFRINKACNFLKDKTLTIGEVALMTGYRDPVVFLKAFKGIVGVSPSQYRIQ